MSTEKPFFQKVTNFIFKKRMLGVVFDAEPPLIGQGYFLAT